MNQASTVSPHICQRGKQDAYLIQVIEQRPGAGLSNLSPQVGGLAANFLLDAVVGADARQGLGSCGRDVDDMSVVDLALSMGLTGDFANVPLAVQVMEAGAGIDLQRAGEVLQSQARLSCCNTPDPDMALATLRASLNPCTAADMRH